MQELHSCLYNLHICRTCCSYVAGTRLLPRLHKYSGNIYCIMPQVHTRATQKRTPSSIRSMLFDLMQYASRNCERGHDAHSSVASCEIKIRTTVLHDPYAWFLVPIVVFLSLSCSIYVAWRGTMPHHQGVHKNNL